MTCLPGLPPLSQLTTEERWGFNSKHPLTLSLAQTIHNFVEHSPGIESATPFAIMPDHIHLLIKLNSHPERLSLLKYMHILRRQLIRTFIIQTGITTELFEPTWHDLIVKRHHQLNNFAYYICNNAHMRLLRQQHHDRFHCTRGYTHWRLGGLSVDLVGTPELLDEPALLAVRLSRKILEGSLEWEKAMAFYDAWRPGMTAVGTWWSKAERAAAQRILANGGNIIHLSPTGFPNHWHPAGTNAQKSCAEGHTLYLSPYPHQTQQLPQGETRHRCLELNTLAQTMQDALVGHEKTNARETRAPQNKKPKMRPLYQHSHA